MVDGADEETGAGTSRGRPVAIDEPLPAPGPASGIERLSSVDTLRGVAVLGILGMNIYAYSLPYMAYENPTVIGGFSGADRAAWWVTYLLFSFKMMPVFSMLFGAGLILMHDRYSQRGISFKRFWYRRILLLMFFGAVHGYLLWGGDILFLYSVCGLFLYLFRKNTARRLLTAAAVFYAVGFIPNLAGGLYFGHLRDTVLPGIERKTEAGEELTDAEKAHRRQWDETIKHFDPPRDVLDRDIEAMRGSYLDALEYRAPLYLAATTYLLIFGSFWPAMGLMLTGMALMKMGVFSASRSKRFYALLALAGYCIGLPLAWLSARTAISNDFAFVEAMSVRGPMNMIAGPLVALGHVGTVMLACSSGMPGFLRRSLSAAGRMALSNYIGQTILCTTIFYGYGLGLYASVNRASLMLLVAGIWILQLFISTLWLRAFRFGPLEWVWRTLTYGRRQPMRGSSGI